MNRHTLAELDDTTRHRLLADEQRRLLIDRLRTASRGTETTLDSLARQLRGTDGSAGGTHRLRCRLHHVHLPMLDGAGVLDYDAETKHVRLGRSWSLPATADSD